MRRKRLGIAHRRKCRHLWYLRNRDRILAKQAERRRARLTVESF